MIQFSIKRGSLPKPTSDEKIGIKGSFNLLLIFGVVCSVLLSGFWRPNVEFTIYHVHVELQNITRDFLLLLLAYGSWKYTAREIRDANEYTWFPIQEALCWYFHHNHSSNSYFKSWYLWCLG